MSSADGNLLASLGALGIASEMLSKQKTDFSADGSDQQQQLDRFLEMLYKDKTVLSSTPMDGTAAPAPASAHAHASAPAPRRSWRKSQGKPPKTPYGTAKLDQVMPALEELFQNESDCVVGIANTSAPKSVLLHWNNAAAFKPSSVHRDVDFLLAILRSKYVSTECDARFDTIFNHSTFYFTYKQYLETYQELRDMQEDEEEALAFFSYLNVLEKERDEHKLELVQELCKTGAHGFKLCIDIPQFGAETSGTPSLTFTTGDSFEQVSIYIGDVSLFKRAKTKMMFEDHKDPFHETVPPFMGLPNATSEGDYSSFTDFEAVIAKRDALTFDPEAQYKAVASVCVLASSTDEDIKVQRQGKQEPYKTIDARIPTLIAWRDSEMYSLLPPFWKFLHKAQIGLKVAKPISIQDLVAGLGPPLDSFFEPYVACIRKFEEESWGLADIRNNAFVKKTFKNYDKLAENGSSALAKLDTEERKAALTMLVQRIRGFKSYVAWVQNATDYLLKPPFSSESMTELFNQEVLVILKEAFQTLQNVNYSTSAFKVWLSLSYTKIATFRQTFLFGLYKIHDVVLFYNLDIMFEQLLGDLNMQLFVWNNVEKQLLWNEAEVTHYETAEALVRIFQNQWSFTFQHDLMNAVPRDSTEGFYTKILTEADMSSFEAMLGAAKGSSFGLDVGSETAAVAVHVLHCYAKFILDGMDGEPSSQIAGNCKAILQSFITLTDLKERLKTTQPLFCNELYDIMDAEKFSEALEYLRNFYDMSGGCAVADAESLATPFVFRPEIHIELLRNAYIRAFPKGSELSPPDLSAATDAQGIYAAVKNYIKEKLDNIEGEESFKSQAEEISAQIDNINHLTTRQVYQIATFLNQNTALEDRDFQSLKDILVDDDFIAVQIGGQTRYPAVLKFPQSSSRASATVEVLDDFKDLSCEAEEGEGAASTLEEGEGAAPALAAAAEEEEADAVPKSRRLSWTSSQMPQVALFGVRKGNFLTRFFNRLRGIRSRPSTRPSSRASSRGKVAPSLKAERVKGPVAASAAAWGAEEPKELGAAPPKEPNLDDGWLQAVNALLKNKDADKCKPAFDAVRGASKWAAFQKDCSPTTLNAKFRFLMSKDGTLSASLNTDGTVADAQQAACVLDSFAACATGADYQRVKTLRNLRKSSSIPKERKERITALLNHLQPQTLPAAKSQEAAAAVPPSLPSLAQLLLEFRAGGPPGVPSAGGGSGAAAGGGSGAADDEGW